MKLLTFILTISLIFNLGVKSAISYHMNACKISKKMSLCCKKESSQQAGCCCAKMKCKIKTKYNDVLPSIAQNLISLQNEFLQIQNLSVNFNDLVIIHFSAKYFYWANPPSQNNIPLLT
jgi:hypothetical protein